MERTKIKRRKNLPSVVCTTEEQGPDFCVCIYNYSIYPIENVVFTYPESFSAVSPESETGTFGLPLGGFKAGIIPPNMKYIRPIQVYKRDYKPDTIKEYEDKIFDFRMNGKIQIYFTFRGKRMSKHMDNLDVAGISIKKGDKESRVLAPADYKFEY